MYSDLKLNKMDKWNFHPFSNRRIDSSKLKMCFVNNTCDMIDILLYALSNTKIDNLEKVCPILYDYLKNRKYI